MKQNQGSAESLPIDNNRLFLLFPFNTQGKEINELLSATYGDVIERLRDLDDNAKIKSQSNKEGQDAWKRDKLELHTDFNKQFKRIFMPAPTDVGVSVYQLHPELLDCVNISCDPVSPATSLEVVLSGVARQRINQALGGKIHTSLWFNIHGVRIVWFPNSPISLFVAEIEWRLPDPGPLDAVWLIEGLYALTHDDQVYWSQNRSAGDSVKRLANGPDGFFTIRELLACLLGENHDALASHHYSATFAQTDVAMIDHTGDALGLRLSQNYSLDYAIHATKTDTIQQQQFSNVRHYYGLNSTATLISCLG